MPKKPSSLPPSDLARVRDELLNNLTQSSKLTEQAVRDFRQLELRLLELEQENTALRAAVEADQAARLLIERIERLEAEKQELLSRCRDAERASSQFTSRFNQVEAEFENLANLFVASNQLYSSMSPRGVTRRIKEVLAQLVGAERYCMYLVSEDAARLVPVASEGIAGDQQVPVRVQGTLLGSVYTSGRARIEEHTDPSKGTLNEPAAVVPLAVDDRVVGVIAVFSTLPQKTRFVAVDFELFRLLGQHAAAALVSASLFTRAEHKLPGLEAFLDLSV
jgi:hypothetical protein